MATIKQIKDSTGTTHDIVDTKNTAGSTNSSSKLYLIGAASQAANPQTYSNSNCYTSDGRLYSSGITSTDNLVLSNNSEESPKIIFQRKTSTDGYYDYQLSGETGGFKFGYSSTSGQGSVTNIATIDSSGNYSGNAATATMASKLGSSTVGSTKRPIYLNAGTPTVCNVGESFLSWGGANFAASWGPIDAAMIPELGANRLEYYPGSKIKIEYSTDNGSTWSVSTASETIKSQIFSSGYSIYLGGSNATKIDKSQYQTRITLTTASTLYSTLNKFAIRVSTSGSSNCWCSIDVRLQSNIESNTNTWVNVANQVTISGWSGWNIINTNGFTTYGNQKASQYGEIRFTFGATHPSSSEYPGLTISRIKGFGGEGWTTPSNKALKGTIYTENSDQTTIWPNTLYPSSNKTINLGTSTRYWNNIHAAHVYIGGTANNTTSKITSDTPTNMYISVNGTNPFVIDASTTSNPIIRASTSLPSKVSLGTSSVPFKDVYADKFNGYTIEKSVPSNAVFTDTVYEHPTSAGNKHIPTGGSSGQYLKYSSDGTATWATPPDTKNTAGSADSSSKLFLIGAKEQSANPQTYSHDTAYVGTDGCLYSNSKKVITVSDTVTTTTDGIMSSTDKTKLNSIATGAEVNVQSDWNVTDSASDAFIKNKPTIPTIPAKNVIYNTHTNGEVAKFDTTTGTITASGYTIAKSVPSDAVFTDTVYTHPTSAGYKHIPSGGSSGQYLKYSSDGTATWATPPDTKNTAGSTNSSSKLYLIGATSQAANPQTYSHDTAYVGTDGCLYSNSKKVITVSDMATTTTDGIMSSEDKTKLDRVIDYITFKVDLSEYTTDTSLTVSINGLLQSDTVPNLKVGDIVKIMSTIEFPTNTSPAQQVAVHLDNIKLVIINSLGVSRICGTLKFDYENIYGNAEVCGRWDDRALRKYGGYYYVKITKINSTSSEPEYLCTILYNNFSGLVSPYSEKTGLLRYDRNIDGINFNGSSNVRHYGTCTTASATAAKTATISNFELNTGSMVVIDFTNDNTAASPTLSISGTGAKSICQLSTSTSVGKFKRGCYMFVYDGTYWQMLNSVETDIYASCTTASATAAKTASINGFTLMTGATALIRFTSDNTAESPTLNISGTGAKSLFLGSSTSVGTFNAGLYLIVYDGTNYRMINSVNATKLSFKTSSNNASYIIPFLDKSSYSSGTNSVYVGQSTTYPFSFNPSTGTLTVKQTSSSDERLKDFVKDLDINFGDLKRIPKKYFTWKCDEEKHLHIGTSAQELEKIYPELVSEYGDEKEGLYKAVDYSTLSIIALAAIDKLNERIEYLENKLKELE